MCYTGGMIQLIAFLGNYGREYGRTRHNTAWMFLDSLPFAGRLSWSEKHKSEFCTADFAALALWLADAGLLCARSDGTLPVPQDAPPRLHVPRTEMTVRRVSLMKSERVGGRLTYTEVYCRDLD